MADISSVLRTAEDETLEEIRREAEAYLAAQLTVALASNQRAMTFFGFLATASTVLASASVTALLSTHKAGAIGWVGIIVVAGFLLSMFFANLAAFPTKFEYVGNTPAAWVSDVASKRPLKDAMAQSLGYEAENIEHNRIVLENSAKFTRVATWIAWVSLAFGGVGSVVILAVLYE